MDLTDDQHKALTLAIISFLRVAFEGVPVNEMISEMAENIYAASQQNGPDGTTEDTGATA